MSAIPITASMLYDLVAAEPAARENAKPEGSQAIENVIAIEATTREPNRESRSPMAKERKNWHAMHVEQRTTGERVADTVAATMGSWRFIIVQSIILTIWIVLNLIAWSEHWDPYPFILLNLALSFQAAYAAPFIMISQNRQSDRDRHQAEDDYRTNVEAERRIEELQKLLAAIEVNKLDRIIALLEKNLPTSSVS